MMRVTRDRSLEGWGNESSGSMLLASMMTVSFGVLLFLGIVNSTLSERVRTEHVVQTAKALQLAHSGVEYALWEINYGDADYADAGWAPAPPNNATSETHTYTGIPNLTVTVADPMTITGNGNDSDPITISSQGRSPTILRTITVQVPARSGGGPTQPGLFDDVIYTRNSRIYLYGASAGAIRVDGYDSSLGSYNDPLNLLPASEVRLGSDTGGPMRQTNWNTRASGTCAVGGRECAAEAIVIDGYATVRADVVVGTPTATEQTTPCSGCSPTDPGFAIYDPTKFSFSGTGNVTFQGSAIPDPRTEAPTFPSPPASLAAGTLYYINRAATPGTSYVVCPNDPEATRQFKYIDVAGETLVLGCSSDSSGTYYCGNTFTRLDGVGRSCGIGAHTQPVVISTGDGTGAYALRTQVYGTTPGKILVYSPTQIDFYRGTSGGLYIASGGIENLVKKGSGVAETVDSSKLTLYGRYGTALASRVLTSQDFYGAIHGPTTTDIVFQTPAGFDFFGALHVRSIRTDSATGLGLHWDKALTGFLASGGGGGGGGGGACSPTTPANCRRPVVGTWWLSNN